MLCQFEGDAQRAWFIEAVERISRIRRWRMATKQEVPSSRLENQLACVKAIGWIAIS